jgi:peptidoglycan hydrolase-like protein with peptidoglycan-binding domain
MQVSLRILRRAVTALPLALLLAASVPAVSALAQAPAAALSESTIKSLQEALNKQGIAVPANGVLNDETRDAIRKYQSQHHLPVTGEADKATLDKLGVKQSAAAEPSTTVAQATPQAPGAQAPSAQAPRAQAPQTQAPQSGGPMSGGMMGGGMMGGGMMQGGQAQAGPPQGGPPQGGMMMNCPMMQGQMQTMTQMMQGQMQTMAQMMQTMMQMMQTMQRMQGQMQPGQMPGAR